jgi:hypothetical protein
VGRVPPAAPARRATSAPAGVAPAVASAPEGSTDAGGPQGWRARPAVRVGGCGPPASVLVLRTPTRRQGLGGWPDGGPGGRAWLSFRGADRARLSFCVAERARLSLCGAGRVARSSGLIGRTRHWFGGLADPAVDRPGVGPGRDLSGSQTARQSSGCSHRPRGAGTDRRRCAPAPHGLCERRRSVPPPRTPAPTPRSKPRWSRGRPPRRRRRRRSYTTLPGGTHRRRRPYAMLPGGTHRRMCPCATRPGGVLRPAAAPRGHDAGSCGVIRSTRASVCASAGNVPAVRHGPSGRKREATKAELTSVGA